MVNQMCKKYPSDNDPNHLIELLLKRQLNEGILLPSGVVIPHLHIENLADTVVSVLIPEKPIETEHGIINIFVMVFTCKSDNSLYLQILQSVMRFSKDDNLYNYVLKSQSPKEFLKILKANDAAVKKTLTVCEVMTEIFSVHQDMTLRELSEHFYAHNTTFFIVVDKNNKPVGEVSILEYLTAGLPDYTKFIDNLRFLRSIDPFEKLFNEEHQLQVQSIMKPIELSVLPNTPAFKTIFLMNKHNKRYVPVIEDDKLLGVVGCIEIFRKVYRG
jgi:mannitol/fructose-specific phosphotransferase system IIA component (Ntr-type)